MQRVLGQWILWIGGTGNFLSVPQLSYSISQRLFRQVFGKGPRKFENSLMQAEQAADINSDFNALIAQRIARRADDDCS